MGFLTTWVCPGLCGEHVNEWAPEQKWVQECIAELVTEAVTDFQTLLWNEQIHRPQRFGIRQPQGLVRWDPWTPNLPWKRLEVPFSVSTGGCGQAMQRGQGLSHQGLLTAAPASPQINLQRLLRPGSWGYRLQKTAFGTPQRGKKAHGAGKADTQHLHGLQRAVAAPGVWPGAGATPSTHLRAPLPPPEGPLDPRRAGRGAGLRLPGNRVNKPRRVGGFVGSSEPRRQKVPGVGKG